MTGSGTSTVTVSTAATDAGGVAGNFNLAVTGTSGGLVHGATAALLLQDFTASFSQAQQDVSCAGAHRYGGDGVHDTVEKINFEKMAKIVKLSYLSGFEFAGEQNPPGLDPRAKAR